MLIEKRNDIMIKTNIVGLKVVQTLLEIRSYPDNP